MAHAHRVFDTDTHFKIDGITRTVQNRAETKVMVVQKDHNSERFTFELPRYIEAHDMSTCNLVQVHYLNIDAVTKKKYSGVYTVDDLKVSEENDELVLCSWLVSAGATQHVGSLNFVVRFACVKDGIVTYAWHTAVHTGVAVSESIDAAEMFETEYVDVIEQWKDSVIQGFAHELVVEAKRASEARYSQLASDLEVERKRIDNIIALPDGSTTGDAEMIDIRVGADGVVYDSAGTAVRNQVNTLAKWKRNTIQLFDCTDESCILHASFSTTINDGSTVRTLFIPCVPSTDYTVAIKSGLWSRFAIGVTSEKPAMGVNVSALSVAEVDVTENGMDYKFITTKSASQYIVVYYWHQGADGDIEEEIRKSIMITSGHILHPYITPYDTVGERTEKLHIQNESEIYFGDEILTNNFTLGEGWSGDVTNGFTHQVGVSTGNLTLATPNLGYDVYKVELTVISENTSKDGCSGFTIHVGGSTGFEMYEGNYTEHTYIRGIQANGSSSLVIKPTSSDFAGIITNISLKKIIGETVGTHRIVDENGNTMLEFKMGDSNVFIGTNNATKNTGGHENVGVGVDSLKGNTTGFWNVAAGHETMMENTVGSRNVALGYIALKSNASGHRNVAIGSFAMEGNTDGHNNIAIGADSLQKNTLGHHNIAMGTTTMAENITGSHNVAIGYGAMIKNTVDANIAIGKEALQANVSGANNIAIGKDVLKYCEASRNNVVIGNGNMGKDTCIESADNIVIGVESLQNAGAGLTGNVVIGNYVGVGVTSGMNNIFIGHNIDEDAEVSNTVRIGNDEVETVIIGNKKLTFNANGTVTWTLLS